MAEVVKLSGRSLFAGVLAVKVGLNERRADLVKHIPEQSPSAHFWRIE